MRAASEPAYRFGAHASGPVNSGTPFLFNLRGTTAEPVADTSMVEASPERSLVLRSSIVPDQEDMSVDALPPAALRREHSTPVQNQTALDKDEQEGESDSKLPGSEEGGSKPGRSSRIFARGAVNRVRRKRHDRWTKSPYPRMRAHVDSDAESDSEEVGRTSLWAMLSPLLTQSPFSSHSIYRNHMHRAYGPDRQRTQCITSHRRQSQRES